MKLPQLICPDGASAFVLRKQLGLNQSKFWGRVGVAQSGGCRYEAGRGMPVQVAWLLHMAYGTDKEANALLQGLRSNESAA